MTARLPETVAVNVGNTRTAVGRFRDRDLEADRRLTNVDVVAIVAAVASEWEHVADEDVAAVVIGSVRDELAESITAGLAAAIGGDVRVLRAERDLPVPVGRCLDAETIVGTDRLLNAAAAFDLARQACVVVDAGTAVTIDFVDGEGTFHGGAIAPGASIQLRALHDHAALLPEIDLARPDEEGWGANTRQAMLHGVYHGLRGAVRHLVERYAEAYHAYPLVVATGGDAHLLFETDEFVERIVDDLGLRGLALTWRAALTGSLDSSEDA